MYSLISSPQVGCDTRSFFKWSSTCFSLDLSFNTGCHRKVYHIYPIPPLGQDMTQGQCFKRSLTGLNSEFFLLLDVASPRLKNLVCPTILPIAGGRIIGFIPFPRVLVLCEMQSVQDLNSCRRVQFLR